MSRDTTPEGAATPTTGAQQLRLIDGEVPGRPDWALTARERRLGRQGIAAARVALARARRPDPLEGEQLAG